MKCEEWIYQYGTSVKQRKISEYPTGIEPMSSWARRTHGERDHLVITTQDDFGSADPSSTCMQDACQI